MKSNFWKAAIWSGIIGAVVMIMLEMIMNPIFLNKSGWLPPTMMGAIWYGKEILAGKPHFDFGLFMSAMAIHFPLSVLYGIIAAFIVKNRTQSIAIVIGIVLGLLLYFINFYGFTAIFPWFAKARNWVQIVIHIIFGVVVAWSFIGIFNKPATAIKNDQ
ncbi:hypothetical protein C7S20_07340 [Christiangramia fulva]|uniref:DUF1440 domain-containing protein n=1 Tax=Christiangramia fulva TaxID=2126553 RepID=A0A2R3Z495_9FLAO|nr:hypothetical protein [Christiangramia fulva]AVR45097.1 hypothetical protein C7S20_07340 [Christiangramia fulva]